MNNELEERPTKTSVFEFKTTAEGYMHWNITINEKRPGINLNLKRAYDNIVNKYRPMINKYSSYFLNLIKSNTATTENGYIFGTGISSKHLSDPRKRYWYRNTQSSDVVDLSVLILIDGSGSMQGERIEQTRNSAVILHEILTRATIPHAIVEHRAEIYDSEIDINILYDFNSKEQEKYNLLKIYADYENRDSLALLWSENYLNKKSQTEDNLIITISDGLPAHSFDDYYPPASVEDTKNIVSHIIHRGTNIVAVALDNEDSFNCYELLSEIYPKLVGCNDLNNLTKQILLVLDKEIFK